MGVDHHGDSQPGHYIIDDSGFAEGRDAVGGGRVAQVYNNGHLVQVESRGPSVYVQRLGAGVRGPPRFPRGQRRGHEFEPGSGTRTEDRLAERLAPHRSGVVVPPGHGVAP